MRTKPDRVFPLPQAIMPGTWNISEDRQARVDVKNRTMYVPVQPTIEHAMVRAHEMSHVTFTGTRKIPKHLRSNMIFQAVEDHRIHHLAELAGVPIHAIGFPVAEMELAALQSAGNLERYVELLLSSPNVNLPIVDAALAGDEYFDESEKTYISDEIVGTARVLLGKGSTAYMRRFLGHNRSGQAWSFKRAIAVAEWIISKLPPPPQNGSGDGTHGSTPQNYSTSNQWGSMELQFPDLPYTPIKKGRITRAADHGAVLTRPDRYLSDMRVFSEIRKRKQTGTVVIDTSGSMNLEPAHVAQIVKDLPAGTIAVYGSGTCDTSKGYLRIIARNGKMLALDSPDMSVGFGNVVDGPALAWLASQARPRIWVCDGHVTGKHEKQSEFLNNECAQIVRAAGIRHVDPNACDGELPAAVKAAFSRTRR